MMIFCFQLHGDLVVVIGVNTESFGAFYSEIEVFQQMAELLLIMKCVILYC